MKHGTRSILRGGTGGSLIITGSPTAIRGHALGEFAYSSSEGGTHAMTRLMANELAGEGIRVNCLIPGFIDTPIDALFMKDQEAVVAASSSIPLRRPGQLEECAGIYVWLASDEASYATGAFFVIDGGQISVC